MHYGNGIDDSDGNDEDDEHRIICNIGDMIAWRMEIYGIALHDTQERIYLSPFNPCAPVLRPPPSPDRRTEKSNRLRCDILCSTLQFKTYIIMHYTLLTKNSSFSCADFMYDVCRFVRVRLLVSDGTSMMYLKVSINMHCTRRMLSPVGFFSLFRGVGNNKLG